MLIVETAMYRLGFGDQDQPWAFYHLKVSGIWGKNKAGSVGQGIIAPGIGAWGGPRAKSTWLLIKYERSECHTWEEEISGNVGHYVGSWGYRGPDRPGCYSRGMAEGGSVKWAWFRPNVAHLRTPTFSFSYALLDAETFNFLLGYPLK